MRVLIVGSKGFIGTHTALFFANKGYETWTCDIVNDYSAKNYFQIDATNADYHQIFASHQFNICINCSGAASVPLSLKKPLKDFTLNTYNVCKLLDAIRFHQPNCKFINLSSAAVYGNPETLPIVEGQSTNPVSPYGRHKLQAEKICEEFREFYNIESCNLRIFSAYGDGLKKQLFWDLFQKSKNTRIVKLYGTGKESRDFIHVKDLVEIIHLVAQQETFVYPIINVGNGEEIFISNVVKTFFELMENDTQYEFGGQERKGDPINWVADISRIKELGYKQSTFIKDGLENYIQWVRKELQ